MKGINEFLGNDNKSRFRKYENILSALNTDEMFPSSENDSDTKETFQWIIDEKKKIDKNEYNNPNAETINIRIYERPNLNDMQNQPQELEGINNIDIDYKLDPKDVLDVCIIKLKNYADSLPGNEKRELQLAATELAYNLAKMKWAVSVLRGFKENPEGFTDQEAKNNFIVAQKILKDSIDISNKGERKFDIKNAFDKFNKLDDFNHITEHYCCVIDRFISTTESVAFELEELDHQIVEDNAYKEIQNRKILSLSKENEFNNKLNNEIDTIITKGYNPESMYDNTYNQDFLVSINNIEKSIKEEEIKLKESEKNLVNAKNEFEKNVKALVKEREELDKSNNEILHNLITKEENNINEQIIHENEVINTNKKILETTKDKMGNVDNEIAEIDKKAFEDELNEFREIIKNCNQNLETSKKEKKEIDKKLIEITETIKKIKNGEIVLDVETKKEFEETIQKTGNLSKQLNAIIKSNQDLKNECIETLKIKKAYIDKLKEINNEIKIDELKESLAENEKLLTEKKANYDKKYSQYKEKYENIKIELQEAEEFKLKKEDQIAEQKSNITWKPGKHSLAENYNYYSNEYNKHTKELEELAKFAPKGYENVIYGYCEFMVDYKQFSINYAPILCDFNGLDPSFFENPAEVSRKIKNFLQGDFTKEQEDFLNQPSNTNKDMTNREVMLMIADNYNTFRRNLILSQIDLKKAKATIADINFTSSDEYKTAAKKADALIKNFAKDKSRTVLQQMNETILKNEEKLKADFNILNKEFYDNKKKQIVKISNKYNSKIGEITANIHKSTKLFADPSEYFSISNIEMTVNPEDNKSFITKVKINPYNKFGLSANRSILTSLAIGKILQNERMSDVGKGRGKETKLYNDVFDPTVNMTVKNKLSEKILSIYSIENDDICRKELANEMFKSLSVCVDIIDDRMYQLNGDMSAQTLLKKDNKYILNIADVLVDIGQEIVRKGPDDKTFVDILKENCKTQEEKDKIDKIVEKATAVSKIIGIHGKNLNTITELANKDLSKGTEGGEINALFAAIERIKTTEKLTSETINNNENWYTYAKVKSSLKKNFSDILTETQEFEVTNGNKEKIKVKKTKADIIFDSMNSGAAQLISDNSIQKSLEKLEGPNNQGVCGVNLLAINYLQNPSSIPGVDFKYDANTATVSNINANSFNKYISGLKLKEPNSKLEMVNVSGQLQALEEIVNYNPLITKINQSLEDINKYEHYYSKFRMEMEKKQIYINTVDNIMFKDQGDINQIQNKVDSINKTLKTSKEQLEDLNNQYEDKIRLLPLNSSEKIYDIRREAKFKKDNIQEELQNDFNKAQKAIKESEESIAELDKKLKNVQPNIENDRKGAIQKEVNKLKEKIELTIKNNLEKINNYELEINNSKTVIKNKEAAKKEITEKTVDIGKHKNNLTNLKNEKINYMKQTKDVIDNINNKINALPNEKARVNQIKVGLADLYNSLEVAREKKHSDTPEFSRMQKALADAMSVNTFKDMKSKLEEINAAAKNYITKKNSWWVPRVFASKMRIARLNGARNIETFCKNKIETCKKYESPYSLEIDSFVNKHHSQEVNEMINNKESFNVKEVFGDQFEKTVDKKMNEKHLSANDKINLKNAVNNFADTAGDKCNGNIQKGMNDNQTLYSNIEKEIPNKAKNIQENIMRLKKNEINKMFGNNLKAEKKGPEINMVKG